jgi:oxepin-CoA hydrolase / 3-oxo-5,6-dehydrosuberyl-CoA semialdehyde dehydrogenase
MQLQSYLRGAWRDNAAPVHTLRDATTGERVAEVGVPAVDGRAVLDYARTTGGAALRALTFHERAGLLKQLAKYLAEHREELYSLSTTTGATRSDSVLDIEGGLGVLFSYASRALRDLPNDRVFVEGPAESLTKSGEFIGQHLCMSRRGVAVQINAYNFPVWGMLEKLAPALLAAAPSVVKPATVTAHVTEQAVRRIVESKILPEGSLQFLCGGVGDLLEHLTCQDSLSFTGSAATALRLRTHPAVVANAVRFTAETDSLNSCLLGPDAAPGTPEFDLFVAEVVREITSKAGQRCTAIRKALAPRHCLDAATEALRQAFATITVGDPRRKDVAMGPLVGSEHRADVLQKIAQLGADAQLLTGDPRGVAQLGADADKGAFIMPTLLVCHQPRTATAVHSVEAFGPVCTVLPYDDVIDATAIAAQGAGSLVSSVFTADQECARSFIVELAPYHGRVLVVDRTTAEYSTGHGSPLPGLIHGGPGRAGGGEELGGLRAMLHHMQRVALQAAPRIVGLFSSSAT